MKTTVVPAQVTTVEDKIAGSLGLMQLLLLIAPIFGGSALFAIVPPFFAATPYKVVLIVCLTVLCAVLAIRVKGKLVLLWAIAILRYNLRPRYYVFDKNDAYGRDSDEDSGVHDAIEGEPELNQVTPKAVVPLSTADVIRLETIMADPDANLHFETNRKGELRVHITKVQ